MAFVKGTIVWSENDAKPEVSFLLFVGGWVRVGRVVLFLFFLNIYFLFFSSKFLSYFSDAVSYFQASTESAECR